MKFLRTLFSGKDLRQGLRQYRYFCYLAFLKLKLDHKKTFFSYLWEPLTVIFVASILSLVWSKILDIEEGYDYFMYILIGFTLWNLLFGKLINRAVSSLSKRGSELTSTVKPISLLPLEDVAYSFLSFATTLPILLIASLFFYGTSPELMGLFIFGLILVLITGVSLSLTLGVLAFFYRDILHVIGAVMRLGFLVTPVIWKPSKLGEYADMIWYNPFYSYLNFCRAPLMGEMPHEKSIYLAIGMTACFSVLAYFTSSLFSDKIRIEVFKN